MWCRILSVSRPWSMQNRSLCAGISWILAADWHGITLYTFPGTHIQGTNGSDATPQHTNSIQHIMPQNDRHVALIILRKTHWGQTIFGVLYCDASQCHAAEGWLGSQRACLVCPCDREHNPHWEFTRSTTQWYSSCKNQQQSDWSSHLAVLNWKTQRANLHLYGPSPDH